MDNHTNTHERGSRRRFGLLGALVLALLIGTVGIVAYNIGLTNGAAEAAMAEGAAVIYAPASGPSTFGLILGLGLAILLIGFVARAFAGPRFPMGHRPWGPRWAGHRGPRGDWDHEDVPGPFRPMLERWHRDAHGGGASAPAASDLPPTPEAPTTPDDRPSS
jgi:hypothetical protein